MQHGFVRLPLTDWGLTPDEPVEVRDLLSNERYFWRGEWNYVRLDPRSPRRATSCTCRSPAAASPLERCPANRR